LGDTLQFCRYVKLLAEVGAKVILEVQPRLAGLLSRMQGISQLLAAGDPLPDFDYHCPLLSLPLAFKTDLATIPMAPAYLSADASRVSHWRARLGERSNIRIGLMWSGNPGNKRDRYRSIRLRELLQYLPAGFQYVSLQNEVREIDAETLRSNPQTLNFADEQQDFDDAAALCECMDLIISVDTSVAHLSGALGKETWVLLSSTPDWRWLLDRTDSPWYPTAKLYRQDSADAGWGPVLNRLSADLLARFPIDRSTP
jgi:ADP-heptose:LPS heptosyltransferase